MAVLRGLWTKLSYMAELCSHDGTYEHWGHRRVHGDENSQLALAAAHSELYVEVLRKPSRELLEDLELSAVSSGSAELHTSVNCFPFFESSMHPQRTFRHASDSRILPVAHACRSGSLDPERDDLAKVHSAVPGFLLLLRL